MNVEPILRRLEIMRKQGAPLDALLDAAVKGLHESNPRFQWTGVYELFPDNVLRLGPFVGPPTDHVFIGLGQGVCGTAIAERRNMNIPDVRDLTNYLACSASTRSELVVLIRSGERIHAQIDIASDQVAAFDDAAMAGVQRVADWLANLYTTRRAA